MTTPHKGNADWREDLSSLLMLTDIPVKNVKLEKYYWDVFKLHFEKARKEAIAQAVADERHRLREKIEELMPHWSDINYEENNLHAGKHQALLDILTLLSEGDTK